MLAFRLGRRSTEMITPEVFHAVNLMAIYSLGLAIVLIIKVRNSIEAAPEILLFQTAILCALLIDIAEDYQIIYPVRAVAFLSPVSFWLLARALFRGKRLSKRQYFFLLTGLLVFYHGIYFGRPFFASQLPALFGQLVSIVFIVFAIAESQLDRNRDPDLQRQQTRRYFLYAIGFVSSFSLLMEIGIDPGARLIPLIGQRLAILTVNSVFLFMEFSPKNRFLIRKKSVEPNLKDTYLAEKIKQKMSGEKLYLQEKLTIGRLADEIDEHEYKVRKVITHAFGFRNFVDYVNSLRLNEASTLLTDPVHTKLSVAEIAHQTGFNSIGPFNRAFKASFGITPTAFRKQHRVEKRVLTDA
ncbi:MAG: helix-turn-helix transcriptional regulator [Bacteroidota bacterium]